MSAFFFFFPLEYAHSNLNPIFFLSFLLSEEIIMKSVKKSAYLRLLHWESALLRPEPENEILIVFGQRLKCLCTWPLLLWMCRNKSDDFQKGPFWFCLLKRGSSEVCSPSEKVCVGNVVSWRFYHLQYWRSNKILLLVDHLVIRSWRYGVLFNFYFSAGEKEGMRSQRCFINQEFIFSCLKWLNFVFALYKIRSERSITYIHIYICFSVKSLQSCLTLCNNIDCSLPGSAVHGILQARRLKRVAMPSSRGFSWPRDQTHVSYVSCVGRQILYH